MSRISISDRPRVRSGSRLSLFSDSGSSVTTGAYVDDGAFHLRQIRFETVVQESLSERAILEEIGNVSRVDGRAKDTAVDSRCGGCAKFTISALRGLIRCVDMPVHERACLRGNRNHWQAPADSPTRFCLRRIARFPLCAPVEYPYRSRAEPTGSSRGSPA